MTTLDYADSRTLWQTILAETAQAAQSEPMLASFLHQTVLRHSSIDRVLAFHLSSKLASPVMDSRALNEIFFQALDSDTRISKAMQADIVAYYERDPTCDAYYLPLLYYKGFHAVQAHRINHWLWQHGRKTLAYFLQNRASEVFGIDIHPAARFGHGIMVDHGTGLVVGETAVLGNDISILHGVTLGGSGKEGGDRHPKIGAGSVAVSDVPAHSTVVGVPARVIGQGNVRPSADMDQSLDS